MDFKLKTMRKLRTSKDIANDIRVCHLWKDDGYWHCLLNSRFEISFGVFSLDTDFIRERRIEDICDYFNNGDWTII